MYDSLYELLEVSPDARQAVIKAAYRCLVQQYHPDKKTGNLDAAEHMSLINHAYSVLGNPLLRARYDRETRLGSTLERRGRGFTSHQAGANDFEDHPTQRPFAFRPLE